MPRTRKNPPAPAPEAPGAAGESDVDAAIAAGKAGGTHKVEKPKPRVPKSGVVGDPERPKKDDNVNARPEMSYQEAMEKLAKGELKRSVLTDQGWVSVPKATPQGPGAKA